MIDYNMALNVIEPKLAGVIGEDEWQKSGTKITKLISETRKAEGDAKIALVQELENILKIYPSAFDAWSYEISRTAWQEIYSEKDFQQDISSLLPTLLHNDPRVAEAYDAIALFIQPGPPSRAIMLTPGSTGKSVKFRNFKVDVGEMAEFSAGAFMAGYNAIKEPHPFVLAAGLLLTMRGLLKMLTVEINEQDTSVYWGFVQAGKSWKTATEAAILESTNRAREGFGLQLLTEAQLKVSLERLKNLKSIAPIGDDTWRITENFVIPD